MNETKELFPRQVNFLKAKRQGAQFIVGSGDSAFVVERDENGTFRCDCPEFASKAAAGERCIHLLSVRNSICNKDSEILNAEPARSETSGENVLKFSSLRRSSNSGGKRQKRAADAGTEGSIRELDKISSNWNYEISEFRVVDNSIFVRAAVTVDGVKREGLGAGDIRELNGAEIAESAALESAALKFINRERNQHLKTHEGSRSEAAADFPPNPLAGSLSDLVTSSQLKMIKTIGMEAGIDAASECMNRLFCSPGELSRSAASKFIEYLQTFPANGSWNAEVRLVG